MRDHPRRREAGPRLDLRAESGVSTSAFLLMMVPIFVLMLGMVYDFAQGYTVNARAINVAEQAARRGAQQIDLTAVRTSGVYRLDTGEAAAAAETFLASGGFPGTASATADSVHVDTTWSVPTTFLGLININEFRGEASADAAMEVGVN